MKDLIERLEAAEVGSQELNGLIFRALANDPSGKDHWFMSCGELMTEDNADSVTVSLDAALALAERVVGDREWLVEGKDRPLGRVHRACLGIVGPVYASTPALALCIAILKAKESQA